MGIYRQLKWIEDKITADLKPVKPLLPAGVLWLTFSCVFWLVVAIGGVVLGTAG